MQEPWNSLITNLSVVLFINCRLMLVSASLAACLSDIILPSCAAYVLVVMSISAVVFILLLSASGVARASLSSTSRS